jgi:hypothetical protein
VTEIVVDTSIDSDGALDAYARTKAARLGQAGGSFAFYRLSPSREQPLHETSPTGAALPIRAIEVNVKPDQVPAMTDGNLETRWDTGPQTGKERVVVDLGAARPVSAIVLSPMISRGTSRSKSQSTVRAGRRRGAVRSRPARSARPFAIRSACRS